MSPARVSEAVMEASKTSAAVSHRLPFTIYVLDVCKTGHRRGVRDVQVDRVRLHHICMNSQQHRTREHKGSVLAFVCQCCQCCCSHRSCFSVHSGFFFVSSHAINISCSSQRRVHVFLSFLPLCGSLLRTAAHVAWWGGSL